MRYRSVTIAAGIKASATFKTKPARGGLSFFAHIEWPVLLATGAGEMFCGASWSNSLAHEDESIAAGRQKKASPLKG
jgi:hypothetical protein